jgi:hypothetical protein
MATTQKSMPYPREKLWQALDSLVGDGTIQQRLEAAAMSLTRLQERDFTGLPDYPAEGLQEQFRKIMQALTNVAAGAGEGTIAATTRQLTNEQGDKIAKEILSLYIAVRDGL